MIPAEPGLLLALAASALAMFVLARGLTGSAIGGMVAAAAWAAWPHAGAALVPLLPLAIFLLHRFGAARKWRDVLALGAVAGLSSTTPAGRMFTPIVLSVAATALAVATGQWRSSRFWLRAVAAAVIAAAIATGLAWEPFLSEVPDAIGGATWLVVPGLAIFALAAYGAWRGWITDARPATMVGLALVAAGLGFWIGTAAVIGVVLLAAIGVAAIERQTSSRRWTALAWMLPLAAFGDLARIL